MKKFEIIVNEKVVFSSDDVDETVKQVNILKDAGVGSFMLGGTGAGEEEINILKEFTAPQSMGKVFEGEVDEDVELPLFIKELLKGSTLQNEESMKKRMKNGNVRKQLLEELEKDGLLEDFEEYKKNTKWNAQMIEGVWALGGGSKTLIFKDGKNDIIEVYGPKFGNMLDKIMWESFCNSTKNETGKILRFIEK